MKKISSEWLIPIFIVIALLIIFLILNYLPSDVFGENWATFKNNLWTYLPWLIVFAMGLFSLKVIISRRR